MNYLPLVGGAPAIASAARCMCGDQLPLVEPMIGTPAYVSYHEPAGPPLDALEKLISGYASASCFPG